MAIDLRAQVEKILSRRDEVQAALSAPDVISDMARFTSLNKEFSDLGEIVPQAEEYMKLALAKENSAEMLADKTLDPEMRAMAQEEYDDALNRLPAMADGLQVLMLPKDEDDKRNVILEIRAGTGGDEAALFAGDLFKMYHAYALTQGWQVEVQELSEATVGGYREVIAKISGHNAFGKLKFESGVHRVQRVPATETQGRVHTSAATVAILPEAQEVDVKLEDKDIRVDVFRSSGPGGQSVNTTDSAVRLTHGPTGIVVQCQDEKSQIKNKAKAMGILRSRILAAKRAEADAERSATRKSLVGSGDRSEKIRTYNYPQNRVTDHRIEKSWHNLPVIMQGVDLDDVINDLLRADEADRLAALAE